MRFFALLLLGAACGRAASAPDAGPSVSVDAGPIDAGLACTCELPNATPVCEEGGCGIGVCDLLYADCNGFPDDGCEVHLNQVAHCGACGNVCAPAHAVPSCGSGHCAVASCEPGWGDCDHDAANGCEAGLWSDTQCGACGVACTGGTTCIDGACAAPQLLFFGGALNISTVPATSVVSAYDLTKDEWRTIATTGTGSPGERAGHTAVWDAAGQRMLVWGGYGSTGATADTDVWALDFGAPGKPVWRKLAASGSAPSLRGWFGSAWDPVGRVLFIYGGWSQSDQENRDGLWQLDVATLTWTQRPEAGPGPRARLSMKWDAPNQRLVLAGGNDESYVARADVSAFDPATGAWSSLATVPGPGRLAPFFFGEGLVLYGGATSQSTFLNTLQELQPMGWVTLPANTGPKRGWMSGAGFGARLFVYGGLELGGPQQVTYFDALYELSEGAWIHRTATGTPHPGVAEASVVVRSH